MTVPDRSEASAELSGDNEGSALVERLAVGEPAAFETLFTEYFNRLRRYAYGYTRSWADAEDLVHDVFLQLWRRRRWLGGVRDFDAYLYRITRNLSVNYVRHQAVEARWRAREAAAHGAIAADADHLPDAEQQLASHERVAAILRAIDALTPRQREVVLLRWRDGRSLQETAAILGITKHTIEIHITRAFKRLRKLLPGLLSL